MRNLRRSVAIVMGVVSMSVGAAVPAGAGTPPMPRFDLDGDGIGDLAVTRPGAGDLLVTHWSRSRRGPASFEHGPQLGSYPLTGDWDGDGRTEQAFWVADEGQLHVGQDPFGPRWGRLGDDPNVIADYDGDGRTDFAVYRPGSPSTWFVHGSTGSDQVVQWGEAGDRPVPGDYDGDGKADIAVAWAGTDGTLYFFIRPSSGGFEFVNFGDATDAVVPGDFDGDGVTDIAVTRDVGGILTWFVRRSTGGMSVHQFGNSATDHEVPEDYDGDGRTDVAVWREQSPGTFFILQSSNGQMRTHAWGEPGDYPSAHLYVR
ncbi:MAG: FG-GAP repeat domain-containing protein [Acidimicrobiia bacterium]